MSFTFSRALVEAFSRATCSDADASAPLSSTPTPDQFWWPDKTTEHSRLSRFGMTCGPLTVAPGEAVLTWWLEAFHAKTSARPAGETGLTESARASGAKWHASFAKYDPEGLKWKTAQCSLVEGLDEFSETWPRWGLMRNGECWERRTWEPPISGTESGSWPTPTVCGNFNYPGASKTSGWGLAAAVVWRTPNASDANKWNKQTIQQRLEQGRQIRLNNQVSPDGSQAGLLNPMWVEWLMGWPLGWTDLRPLETAKFREWQQQHGAS